MEFNGSALEAAREAKTMSRELLAGLAGCSVQTIVNAEEGKHQPKGEIAAAMAHHLGISLDSLYRLSEEPA
jgi:DNA-binding XRE family transcriptional regulator